MPEQRFVFTRHALEKMAMLGISIPQVREAVRRGAKVRQADGLLASYTYLKVAYRKAGEGVYKIKTVYVE
ncbi:DUF4258 domain-containing protein [Candidatus Woesearchaeota archaeon]|nr:DUF4258 domain-containing protein [Candidatus Woesearchaeota archaeon]